MSNVESAVETITLSVAGMSCGSCERRIRKELDLVPGYRDAKADLAAGRVNVSYDPGAATPGQMVAAVVRAGYPAEVAPDATEVRSDGAATCGCCAPRNS